MSYILKRPMFRRGGSVDSRGTGITSGLDKPRQNYADGDIVEIYEKMKERIPETPKPKLSTSDFLRIASAGAEILGAPGEGGGIGGALRAAAGPLSKLGTELGTAIDRRQLLAEEQRTNLIRALTAGQADIEAAKLKAQTTQEYQKDYSYNRIAFEKSKIYADPSNRGHTFENPQGYGFADAERNIHNIPTVPYKSAGVVEGKTQYGIDRNKVRPGEVYFDPEDQTYSVFGYDDKGRIVLKRTFGIGDANREQARKYAKTIPTQKPEIKSSEPGSNEDKGSKDTSQNLENNIFDDSLNNPMA